MRLKLIACEIFEREVRAAVSRSSNSVEVEFLAKAPHHLTDREMLQYVQCHVDRSERSKFQAVLLVSGSCKHGLTGLRARSVPLVLPRAKDCISLLIERSVPLNAPASAGPRSTSKLSRPLLSRRAMAAPSGCASAIAESHRRDAPQLARPLDFLSDWRRFNPSQPAAIKPATTVIDLLVNGYWNYAEFLVVAPGWRVVVDHEQGVISTEEILA